MAKFFWKKYINCDKKTIQFLFAPFFAVSYIVLLVYFNLVKTKIRKNNIIIIHGYFYGLHALISKLWFKTKIIIDTHDLYAALTLSKNKHVFEKYIKVTIDEFIIRKIYKYSDLRITVSNSLAAILESKYSTDFYVIRNCTDIPLAPPGLDNVKGNRMVDHRLQGIFVGNNKQGLSLGWLADKKWTESNVDFHFYGEKYEKGEISVHDHVKIHPAVDFNIENFDFGFYDFAFFPYSIDHENIQVALPNGFFLLARAGLPCLLPINQEFESINSEFSLGVFVDFMDSDSVYKGIINVTQNCSDYQRNIFEIRRTFSWQSESQIFAELLLNKKII